VAAPEECWGKLTACSGPICCELIVEPTPAAQVHTLAYANPQIDECGLIKGIVILWIDITERRRLEHELSRTRRLEAIGTLAGGMAHEFNNLLASIMGNIQIAELDLADEHPAKASVHQAVLSCRSARDLVARMLNFSRNSNPNQTTTALEPLLENTVQLLRLCLPKSVNVDLTIQPCPPVRCIPDELTQAILHLGINAGQALEQRTGSVRFSLRHEPPGADVLARYPDVRPEHAIQITVADTGVGMNPATLERLFDPFFTTRDPGHGSGLGLPEVYGAMKRMRGTIVVESEAGTGTRVRLFLPPAGTTGSTPPIP
jgi:signal transduction histidine kinase